MVKEIKDKAASVKARLLNLSRRTNIEFDALLLRYLQERFLCRLAVSDCSGNFILKGGFLLVSLKMPWSRPTKDIDFLARGVKNDPSAFEHIFKSVAELAVDDSVIFDSSSIVSEQIIENSEYVGIRLKMNTFLGKARKMLQFDIGFGDAVWPEPDLIEFPALLEPIPVKLQAYPTEAIIAEKFEIMVKKEILNSRMKDFFDIYSLSFSYNFDGPKLQKAIETTFDRRQTPLNRLPQVFREKFHEDKSKQRQWTGYLRNSRLVDTSKDFAEIMRRITIFLKPMVISIMEQKKLEKSWNAQEGIWG